MITYRLANKADKKEIKRFYKTQQYSAGLKGYDITYLAMQNNSIIGTVICSGLCMSANQYLLHGLVVNHYYHHQGLASNLINHCWHHLYSLSSKALSVVCFAEQNLAHLYLKNNFNVADANKLTPLIKARYEAYLKTQPQLIIFYRDNQFFH